MKKILITLLALAGVAVAATEVPVAVWSLENVSLGGHAEYTTDARGVSLSSLNITGASGYTAMITMNWTQVSNAPAFWFATTAGVGYTNSTATFGYRGDIHHACLFNNTSGSNSGCRDNYEVVDSNAQPNDNSANAPDYISSIVGNDARNTDLASKTLTYFITSENGTSKLYELLNDGSVTQIATQTGMQTGTLGTFYAGHWNNADSHQAGTMDVQLFGSVLDTTQMKSLIIPEPATATLSLLALCGLAARRRRK